MFLLLGLLFMNLNQSDFPWPIRFYVMETDSMSSEIPRGSLLASVVNKNLYVDDVISYKYPLDQSKTVTHRITSYRVDDGVLFYQTKGDANTETDQWEVREDLIMGKVFFTIPEIGKIFNYFKNPWIVALLIFIPVLVIATVEIYYEKDNLLEAYGYFYQKIKRNE